MEKRQVSTVRGGGDRSSVIAAFFIGVATSLFILLYWLMIKDLVIFLFMSLATFIIFLVITTLLARPRSTQRVVNVTKIEAPKEEKKPENKTKAYTGSTQTQKYHKSTCRFAKSIKPQFRVESDDKSFFKKYKACQNCKPQK
ncbi:MAG: hypothetical protein ABH864_05415 [archaeon]